MNRYVLRAWLVIGLGIIVSIVYVYSTQNRIEHEVVTKAPCSESAWVSVINKVGARKSYKLLGQKVRNESVGQKHTEAHCFGGALYTAVGIDGFKTCDSQFSYGCFHEFMGNAIADRGIGIIKNINTQCIDEFGAKAGFCQHGIGHGLVAYFGYTLKDLKKELSVCHALRDNDSIGGCNGGIFMEYNIRSLITAEPNPRPVVKGDFRYPCDDVPAYGQGSCGYWSPQWWLNADLKHDINKNTFKIIGERCYSFLSTEARSNCFSGIGTVLSMKFDSVPKKVAISLCAIATSEFNNKLYRESCIKTALGM